MKKTLSLIIAAVLVFSSAVFAFAEDACTLSFGTASVSAGDSFILELSVENNIGIAGLAVSLDYPAEVFTLDYAAGGSLFSSFTSGKNFLWDENTNVTGDGVLASFTFTVNEGAEPGDYPIGVIVRSCTDENYNDVACSVTSGTVSVCCLHKNTDTIPGVSPTCVKEGLTESIVCMDCGETLKEQTVINATGHSWDGGVVTAAPTADKDGEMTFTCSVCQTTKTETIPKLNDSYTPGDVDMDGFITSGDARLALRRSVGLEDYEEGSAEFLACDVDFDGEVTSGDARLILRGSVGLEDPETWIKEN